MTDTRTTARKYFDRLAGRDDAGLDAILADDIVITLPLSPDGTPEPWAVFTGREQAMAYLRGVMTNFSRLALTGEQWHVSDDERWVHVHAQGDLATADGRPYRNVYVFRLEVADGRVHRVDEYANPVVYTQLGLG